MCYKCERTEEQADDNSIRSRCFTDGPVTHGDKSCDEVWNGIPDEDNNIIIIIIII